MGSETKNIIDEMLGITHVCPSCGHKAPLSGFVMDLEEGLAAINKLGLNEDWSSIVAASHPKLSRNMVWCKKCGISKDISSKSCLRNGWPECCGETMTIDSPEERE